MAAAHPLLRLAVARPDLLAAHAAAYGGLAADALAIAAAALQSRLTLQLAALAALTVAAVLAGVAVLLWLAVPGAGSAPAWALAAVPAAPAVVAVLAVLADRSRGAWLPFAALRRQIAADAAMLRHVAGPP